MVTINHALAMDIADIAPLFDSYRQFYNQRADLDLATTYLRKRLERGECTVFIARDNTGKAVGFTQLYPSYCSVAAKRIWVLYDLFVCPSARRQGIAKKLMQAAQAMGADTQSALLRLETATTNIPGQTLYESLGWERDTEFFTYTFTPDTT